MTIKNLFLYSFLQWLFFSFLKLWFFKYEILSNAGWQNVLYWFLCAVITAAIIRRFGVINYLEAIFLIIVWILGNLFMDLLLLSAYIGLGIFSSVVYWIGHGILALSALLFHKKRHIHVRKLLDHSHGHH